MFSFIVLQYSKRSLPTFLQKPLDANFSTTMPIQKVFTVCERVHVSRWIAKQSLRQKSITFKGHGAVSAVLHYATKVVGCSEK